MNRPRLWPSGLYYTLFFLIGLAGLLPVLNLIASIGQPFGGYYAGHNRAVPEWSIDPSTPPWWFPMARQQLFNSDILVAIDGHTYENDASQFYEAARRAGHSTVTLTIIRNEQPRVVILTWRLFTWGNLIDLKLPDLINGLGFWVLGLTVFAAQPDNRVNRVFGAAASLIAGSVWLSIVGLFKEDPGLTLILNWAWVPCASFVGITIAHLALLYPLAWRQTHSRLVWSGYALSAVVALTYMVAYGYLLLNPGNLPALTVASYCDLAVIGGFGLGVLVYVARLLYLLARPQLTRRLRRQALLLLLGAAFTLPYIGIIVTRGVFNGQEDYFALGLDLRYLALATPITFAFVILRYQTLQRINPAVAGVFILATSALLASLTAWLMRFLEPAWETSLNVSPFAALFFVTILTAGFYGFQNTLRGTFSKVFQWEFRGYTAVRRFTQQIVARPQTATLPLAITQALTEKLELDWVGLWVLDDTGKSLILEAQTGWESVKPSQRVPYLPADWLGLLRPFHLQNLEAGRLPWLADLGRAGMLEVAAPLMVNSQLVGVLGLGKRWDEEIFDDRDLEIIELTAQEVALFILTARQIEELRKVPLQITAAQEHERFKIAQELHDTVQQFLGRLPFYLQISQKNARTNPAETEAILQRSIGEVESAAQTVRQIRSNLAPFQLEAGLLGPLHTLIQQFNERTGIEIRTYFEDPVDSALTTDARHALYRVIQQALDNAATHGQAHSIVLALQVQADRLLFSIADDGQGVPPEEIQKAQKDGSFGLLSMRARITSLGGEFNFSSAPNAGATVAGWLPAAPQLA